MGASEASGLKRERDRGSVTRASYKSSVWVSDAELVQARATSPEILLLSRYAQVRRERAGRTLVVPQVLRADLRDGRWVACDWSGNGIGDAVALARYVLGCSFVDAVRALIGVHQVSPAALSPCEEDSHIDRPRLPAGADPSSGRAYLVGRGLTEAVVLAAEACGALRHLTGGVAFLGLDRSGAVRAATVRYFSPKPMSDGSMVTKRDLKGSDKAFPVLFEGDSDRVVVLEGAVSGLAAQSLSEFAGRQRPTAVVTGGVNPLRWLSEANSKASLVVANASSVTVVGENELDPTGAKDKKKQARTDAARAKLVQAIASIRRHLGPDLVYPPPACKDAAEWLVRSRQRQGTSVA